jgi:hypothetical protein
MGKVVPYLITYNSLFYLKFLEYQKTIFDRIKFKLV